MPPEKETLQGRKTAKIFDTLEGRGIYRQSQEWKRGEETTN